MEYNIGVNSVNINVLIILEYSVWKMDYIFNGMSLDSLSVHTYKKQIQIV